MGLKVSLLRNGGAIGSKLEPNSPLLHEIRLCLEE